MRTKTIFNYVVAALFCCCVTGMFTSCKSQDDTGSANNPIAVNKIKQGVWTEYDTALSASGKYTEEELEGQRERTTSWRERSATTRMRALALSPSLPSRTALFQARPSASRWSPTS